MTYLNSHFTSYTSSFDIAANCFKEELFHNFYILIFIL